MEAGKIKMTPLRPIAQGTTMIQDLESPTFPFLFGHHSATLERLMHNPDVPRTVQPPL
jgi:hypothetical protein